MQLGAKTCQRCSTMMGKQLKKAATMAFSYYYIILEYSNFLFKYDLLIKRQLLSGSALVTCHTFAFLPLRFVQFCSSVDEFPQSPPFQNSAVPIEIQCHPHSRRQIRLVHTSSVFEVSCHFPCLDFGALLPSLPTATKNSHALRLALRRLASLVLGVRLGGGRSSGTHAAQGGKVLHPDIRVLQMVPLKYEAL